jgi:NADH-quinone oxidoreductase subunit J
MTPALFVAFGALLVVSSLLVILHRNPVTSALYLVLAFCSLAGIYLVLQAEFIGMVQIIVYAGAIMVLFLFVIMYLNLRHDVETGVQILLRRGIGWLVGGLLVVQGALMVGRHVALGPVSEATVPPGTGNAQALGQVLYSRYLFPFEITSIVLLVAMVGAVVIAKGRTTRPTEAAAPLAAVRPVEAPAPVVAPPPPPASDPAAPPAAASIASAPHGAMGENA